MDTKQRDSRRYYPSIIDQEKTERKIKVQRNVVRKMIHFLEWTQKIPQDLIELISSFCFYNPIYFTTPVYVPLSHPLFKGQKQMFFIYNPKNRRGCRLQILGFWEQKQGSYNDLMSLAKYFCTFLPLENTNLSDNKFVYQKWNVVTKHAYKLLNHFRTVIEYEKKGIFNKYVLEAFTAVMNTNILLLKLNGIKYIYICEKNTAVSEIQAENDLNISLEFVDRRWKLRMSNINYEMHEQSMCLKKRGQQKIFTKDFHQLILNDIFYIN